MSQAGIDSQLHERRLSAILAADVVGYSRLMGADEEGTLQALKAHRRMVVDPAIANHRGRIVKTTGDGMLVEFASAVDAVRCAVDVQRSMAERSEAVPPERRIQFRIGINVGDILGDGSDIYGDGVNIAARLEAMADPGGIYVSRTVRDPVRDKLSFSFEDLGEVVAKNIARPIHVFRVRHDTETTRSKISLPRAARRLLVAALAVLVVAGAGTAAWFWREYSLPSGPTTTSGSQTASPLDKGLAKAPRLSFVVLPFRNLGGEGLDDATVDALTEDVTSNLSRYSLFSVIGSSSAFIYKGKAVDVRRIGEELTVRYAVEGSVRRVEGKLRVTVQLVSTETGNQIWADHFGAGGDGVSYNSDDVARQIVNRLLAVVTETESARGARERPTNPDAIDLLLQANSLDYGPLNPQRLSQKIELLERAEKLDPSSAEILATLGETLLGTIAPNAADDPTAPEKISRVEELVRRSLQLRPNSVVALTTHVSLLFMQNRCQELIPTARRTISLYPHVNGPPTLLGGCLMLNGQAAEAIPSFEQVLRSNPRNPNTYIRYRLVGFANLFLGRYDEAILSFNRSIGARPDDIARSRGETLAGLAAAQALAGQDAEARASAVEATRIWPTITARSYYPWKIGSPIQAEQVEQLRRGLRLAGIRDHADENEDTGTASDNVLHSEYEAPTPMSAPGAKTIGTAGLTELIQQRKPLILDVSYPWGNSISGAVGLWGGGIGGSTSDAFQERMGRVMQLLSRGDKGIPIVTVGWNSERYQGRNLALRLVALGYTEVYWYRGGREAWAAAGLPQSEITLQEW
jgi:class 3 adenylate cyclase/TolB-like protein/tetratricopeptide (TPR) repeat protein